MSTSFPTVKNVWIVDDDSDDQAILIDVFLQLSPSIRLTTLSDGKELLSALYTISTPDLVFLDLNMMGKTGHECLKEIRADARFQNLPIIVYSSSPRQIDMTYSYGLGASLYIRKPSDYKTIVAILGKVLQMNWALVEEITNQQFVGGKYVPFEV